MDLGEWQWVYGGIGSLCYCCKLQPTGRSVICDGMYWGICMYLVWFGSMNFLSSSCEWALPRGGTWCIVQILHAGNSKLISCVGQWYSPPPPPSSDVLTSLFSVSPSLSLSSLSVSLSPSLSLIPHYSIELVTQLVVVISTCLFHLMNQAWL